MVKFQHIYLENYVNSVCKITQDTILIGLNSGKILYSKIYLNNNLYCLETINSFYAHLKPINIIEMHLDLIITSGLDNYVYIRKKYDFEVLSCIKIDKNYYIKLIKINSYFCEFKLLKDDKSTIKSFQKVFMVTLKLIYQLKLIEIAFLKQLSELPKTFNLKYQIFYYYIIQEK
jgi:hypothetical protein